MVALQSQLLMTLSIDLGDSHMIGMTPAGRRRVDTVAGGRFAGPRVRGIIRAGGMDCLLVRTDGSVRPDVRLVLCTEEGEEILMQYEGIRHGAPDVMRRLAAGEPVADTEYYLRTTPRFETASERLAWLNHVVAVGVGRRLPEGAEYTVFEIL
jgi:hypothetical protein